MKAVARLVDSLETLDLSFNEFVTDQSVASLAAALTSGSASLKELDLSGTKVTDQGVRGLAEAAKLSGSLTSLHLCYLPVSDAGVLALAETVRESSVLSSLHLNGVQCSPNGMAALANAVATALPNALAVNPRLVSLNLCNNAVTDVGAAVLARALVQRRSSRSPEMELVMRSNRVTDAGALVLAHAVIRAWCPTFVLLRYCPTTDRLASAP